MQQNKTTPVQLPLTTLSQETRWAYSITLPSPHEAFVRYNTTRDAVQIAAATLSGNSLRQTVHTHCASVHQAAKLVAALLRVAGVTAGLAESSGSLPPGL